MVEELDTSGLSGITGPILENILQHAPVLRRLVSFNNDQLTLKTAAAVTSLHQTIALVHPDMYLRPYLPRAQLEEYTLPSASTTAVQQILWVGHRVTAEEQLPDGGVRLTAAARQDSIHGFTGAALTLSDTPLSPSAFVHGLARCPHYHKHAQGLHMSIENTTTNAANAFAMCRPGQEMGPLPLEIYKRSTSPCRMTFCSACDVRPIKPGQWTMVLAQEREKGHGYADPASVIRYGFITAHEDGRISKARSLRTWFSAVSDSVEVSEHVLECLDGAELCRNAEVDEIIEALTMVRKRDKASPMYDHLVREEQERN